jgi:hypothetical protein
VTVQIDDERISGNTTGGDWHLDTVAGMVAPQRPMRHKLSALLMGSWRRQLAFLGVNPWPG